MRNLLSLLCLASVIGCCGHPGRENESGGNPPRSHERVSDSKGENVLQGTYTVTGRQSQDDGNGQRVVSIVDEDGIYKITREVGLEAVEYPGLEVRGCLGFADAGEGGIIGIYKKVNGKLAGLWMYAGGANVFSEQTKGATALRPSGRNFAGAWYVTGSHPDGSEPYEYPMTLEREGDAYKAEAEFEAGESVEGSGLAVDNVLVLGFDTGGSKIIKVLELRDSRLEGKWTFSYRDDLTGEPVTVVGKESASRR
jgi:hypothetical protein